MIKQTIPNGWIAAKTRFVDLEHTTIPHRQIVTDWTWRNRHAEPSLTTIIPLEFSYRDQAIANYYHRIA